MPYTTAYTYYTLYTDVSKIDLVAVNLINSGLAVGVHCFSVSVAVEMMRHMR
jgi:hypothetical protein